jgi:U3 small nucleolar RNA-associated protein 11
MNIKTLKKYIPKRKYRERSQLENRKRLGLLEKKQDYKIRSDDFHKKEKRFKKIKEQIRTKNPEEFYFKMANSKMIVYLVNLRMENIQI